MKFEDLLYACERIAGISAVPVRIYDKGVLKQLFYSRELSVDPILPYEAQMLKRRESVSYLMTPFHQYYGIIRHQTVHVLLGPVGLGKYSRQEQCDYAFALGVGQAEFSKIYAVMKTIPAYPIENFLHILLMINFDINGEKKVLSDIAPYLQPSAGLPVPLTADEALSEDETPAPAVHSAITYERRMLALIRTGDTEGLQNFFMREIHGSVGNLAQDPLRHQKNLLVVSATLASRAAIEGGLSEDEAMELSDIYIRRGEELFSPEAISQLQYRMMLDYTRRVSEMTLHAPLSPILSGAVNYIRRNLSAPLDTVTLAKRFHVSRNHLDHKFKEELGTTPAKFVLEERLKRARVLLSETDKPLADIADYLGFSSQSHFQTRFKQAAGMTPMEYRSMKAIKNR